MSTTRTLMLTALLTASPLALAGPHHDGHERGGQDPMAGATRQLAAAVRHLDLSEEQETAIREIVESNREDLKANMQASREVREEIRDLLAADALDEGALAKLAEREGELAEERVLLGGTMASSVLAELDDDQRAELQALRAEREDRRRERFSERSRRN